MNEPFPGYKPVKQILKESDPSMYVKDLMSSRPDEQLYHLLLSDSDNLLRSIEHDFPELAKVHVIGKTVQGRDMNLLEINWDESSPATSGFLQLHDDDLFMDTAEDINAAFGDDDKPKRKDTGDLGHQSMQQTNVMGGQKPAILLTGATHARELISTSLATFEMLKTIGLGYVRKEPRYEKMLQ